MKKQFITEPSKAVPTANIAVNKSRIKIYENDGDMPTYYLQKGQEFQIELYNPTQGTVLAKIFLNNTAISQGGLVLKPGQRVFLDRYLDVAKKFLFDTYEVSNSEETKKAIEKNGDFKVEFFKEQLPVRFIPSNLSIGGSYGGSFGGPNYGSGTYGGGYAHTTLSTNVPTAVCSTLSTNGLIGTTSTAYYNANITNCSGSFSSSVTTDALSSYCQHLKVEYFVLQKNQNQLKLVELNKVQILTKNLKQPIKILNTLLSTLSSVRCFQYLKKLTQLKTSM